MISLFKYKNNIVISLHKFTKKAGVHDNQRNDLIKDIISRNNYLNLKI